MTLTAITITRPQVADGTVAIHPGRLRIIAGLAGLLALASMLGYAVAGTQESVDHIGSRPAATTPYAGTSPRC